MKSDTKFTKKTIDLFNKLDDKLRNTSEKYRYRLGVNGMNEILFTDFRTMSHIKGNRAIQEKINTLLQEVK